MTEPERETEPELLELATAVSESSGSLETYVADLSQPEEVATLTSQIVERHGGRVWLESPAGGGAAFHFLLTGSPQEAHDERGESAQNPSD